MSLGTWYGESCDYLTFICDYNENLFYELTNY